MTTLIGCILLLLGLLHWLVEPLEAVLTSVLRLGWLGWLVLPLALWLLSGRQWERTKP
jgi:hypothetical protein|tara:strand:- start:57 stop:230 length:174 start_codon:yes stop_codon:yes gene_type:complete